MIYSWACGNARKFLRYRKHNQQILHYYSPLYQASEGKIVMFTHPYIVKCYLNKHFPDYEVPLSTNSQIVKLTFKNNEFSLISMDRL